MQSHLFTEPWIEAQLPKEEDRSLLYITIGVLLAHLVLLFWLNYFSNKVIDLPPASKRMVVQTVHLKKVANPIKSKAVAAPQPTPVLPMAQPVPVEEPAVPAAKAEPEKVIPPKEKIVKQEELIEEVSALPLPKSLPQPKIETAKVEVQKPAAKIDKKAPPKAPAKPLPKKVAAKKTAPEKTTSPKQQAAKTPPKPASKAETKKPTPVTAPVVDPQIEIARQKRLELLNNAQERIAKIGESRDKLASAPKSSMVASASPALLSTLTIDSLSDQNGSEVGAREISYREELAQRLKLQLRLPEHGEVRVKLTLERSGRFSKLVVVTSGSKKNQAYIEKTIPTLSYPGFGDRFGTAKDYTFVLSLNNDL